MLTDCSKGSFMDQKIYRKTVCPLDCPDTCSIVATLADGRVIALAGDKDHPYTNGFICKKMKRYHERVYSDDRILYPQLRVGAKGKGEFRRIGWDEALKMMAERFGEIIERFGGEAILPYSYAGNMGMLSRYGGYPFFHRMGFSRLLGTICSAAAGAGWEKQCGPLPGAPPENSADADLIVAWGINVKVSNVHFWQYIAAARKKGAKLLVIDPYRNQTGKSADLYCQVRPGGDTSLALGIMKYIEEKELYDRSFTREQTTGFADFCAVLRDLAWDEIEQDCGLQYAEIVELAQLLTKTPKTFIRIGIGMTRNSRGGMAVRAVTSLAAMLGLQGGGKGRGVLLSAKGFRGKSDAITRPDMASGSARVINMIHLGHALTSLEPPIKGLFVYNTNPASVNPDGSQVRKGLAREDLFTVVHEQVMTPTARYADLLLPATTFLENRDLYSGYGQFYLQVTSPVIPPVGEARSNFELFSELAVHMGASESPFTDTIDQRLIPYLQSLDGVPADCSVDDILQGRVVHSTYSCSDGDVLARMGEKFHFVSRDIGAEPQTSWLTPRGESRDPDLLARYPFELISPPHPDLLNSTFGERYPGKRGELLIHPDDAARFNIVDGGMVEIMNFRGVALRNAKITTDTRPGVVVAEGIFWAVDGLAGGINDVTSQKETDMGGGATFHETLVAVTPV